MFHKKQLTERKLVIIFNTIILFIIIRPTKKTSQSFNRYSLPAVKSHEKNTIETVVYLYVYNSGI